MLEHKTVKVHKINEFNMDELSRDIEKSDLLLNPPTDLDELVSCYNDTLSKILNQHAPVQEKKIVLRPHAPWYTESIRNMKC